MMDAGVVEGSTANWRDLLSIDSHEAAVALGMSVRFLLKIAREGRIGSVVTARKIRFTPGQILEYQDSQMRAVVVITPKVRRRAVRGDSPPV